MKFSMNGFRHQLHRDVADLKAIVEDVLSDEYFDKDELIEAVNAVISHSNTINCVSDGKDPDFTLMCNVEIEHLEPR